MHRCNMEVTLMTFILSFVPIVVPFGILIILIAFTAAFLQSKEHHKKL